MARYTGAGLYMTFKGTAINADFLELTVDREMGMVEATAGADVHETYLNTYKKGSFKVSLADLTDGTATTAYKNLMIEGASGTFIYGEEGTASGKPKHTMATANVKKLSQKMPFAGRVELEVEFQSNSSSGWSDGTW
jgi:hypothetical protein